MADKLNFNDFILAPDPSRIMTGVAGEYFVCGELCRRDILALLTPKNNPLFDVVATNPKGDKSLFISVKTMGIENKKAWRLSMELTSKRNNPHLYVVLVVLKVSDQNDFYIYPFDELVERVNEIYKKYIAVAKRNGEKRKDVNWRWFGFEHFTEEDRKKKNNWGIIQKYLG